MKYTLKGYGVVDEDGRVDYREPTTPGLQLWKYKRDAQYDEGNKVVRVKVTVEVEE